METRTTFPLDVEGVVLSRTCETVSLGQARAVACTKTRPSLQMIIGTIIVNIIQIHMSQVGANQQIITMTVLTQCRVA